MPYPLQLQPESNTPIDGLLVFFYSRVIKYGYNIHAVTRRLKSKLTTAIVPYHDDGKQGDREVRDVIAGARSGGGSTCSTTVDTSYRVWRYHHHRRRRRRRQYYLPENDCEHEVLVSGRSGETVGGSGSRSLDNDDDARANNPGTSLRYRIKRKLTKRPYRGDLAISDGSSGTLSQFALMEKGKKYSGRRGSILSIFSACRRPWSFIFRQTIHRYNPDDYDAFLKGTSVDDYRRQAAEIYRVMPLENQSDPKPAKRKTFKRRLLRIY
ncbi:hypothetical protein V1525DRAFT_407482 [Lipomyces kononenkoae]|uniref:Uncharacterized protein n=1 Tax=Lipomyces kononenkoae TaxID=34357 RepID=A0ACC3SXB5_LIPKO